MTEAESAIMERLRQQVERQKDRIEALESEIMRMREVVRRHAYGILRETTDPNRDNGLPVIARNN